MNDRMDGGMRFLGLAVTVLLIAPFLVAFGWWLRGLF